MTDKIIISLIYIINILLLFGGAMGGVVLGNYLWHKKKWKISIDEKKQEINLEVDEPKKKEKVRFVPDATQEQLDEMNQPSQIKRLLKKLKRDRKD